MKAAKIFASEDFTARSYFLDSGLQAGEINAFETFLNAISGDCARRHRKAVALAGHRRPPTIGCSEQTRISESQPIPFRFVPGLDQWLTCEAGTKSDLFLNETLVCCSPIT